MSPKKNVFRRTRLEKILYFLARLFGRTATFLVYFRAGKEYGYPTCCVAHFAWNAADPKFRRAKRGMAKERGSIFVTEEMHYVPCGFHMRRSPHWRAWNEDKNRRQLRLFTMEPKR